MSRANPRYHRNNPNGLPVSVTEGIVRYKIVGSIESQLTVCDFDFHASVPNPTQTQLTTLLAAISGGIFPTFKALVSADWTCTYETLDVVHRNDIMGVKRTTNAATAGTRGAGHEPTEVCQPILKLTGLKGQHGRGRVSIPAIASADVTNSAISAAGWQTAAATFITAVGTGYSDGANTWFGCVSTRPKGLVNVMFYSLMTGMRVCTYLGTCRRRKIGRGR